MSEVRERLAASLDTAAAIMAQRALAELQSRAPSWTLWQMPDGRHHVYTDLCELLSQLADALRTQRAELFVAQARRADGVYARQGRPTGYLDALVVALDREAEELEAPVRAEVARLLARVRIVCGSAAARDESA